MECGIQRIWKTTIEYRDNNIPTQSIMAMANQVVWVQLYYYDDGAECAEVGTAKITASSDIDDLNKAVHKEFPNGLKHTDPGSQSQGLPCWHQGSHRSCCDSYWCTRASDQVFLWGGNHNWLYCGGSTTPATAKMVSYVLVFVFILVFKCLLLSNSKMHSRLF